MDHQGHSLIAGLDLTEVLDQRRSAVWRAFDSATGTEVAVKMVEPAYESILPRRFGHRNRSLRKTLAATTGWVPIIDIGTARDGLTYVASPFYRGGSVADQLEHGSTPWFPAADLAVKVATTIGAAHNRGCSFGYLRPSNILYQNAKTPLVAVYGSATRHFDDGTAHFTAPELGQQSGILPASDVFSISLVFASLIAGREIDHSESATEILAEIDGRAPARILEIIDYGLSHQLQNRFADAAKMARALTAAMHEIEVGEGSTDGVSTASSNGDNGVLDELLTEPMVDPMGDSFVPAPQQRFSDGNGPEVAINHPGLPASLQDLTISRLPRPVRSASVPDVSLIPIADDPDADESWDSDPEADTGPIGFDSHLDSPTAIPFPPLESNCGPLSDLLDPVQPKVLRPVDPFDPDPTMDHHQGRVTREEINELIAEFGYRSQDNTAAEDTTTQDTTAEDTTDDGVTGADSGDGDESAITPGPMPGSTADEDERTKIDLKPEEPTEAELSPNPSFDLDHAEKLLDTTRQTIRPSSSARILDTVYGLTSARRRLAQTMALLGILCVIGFAAIAAITSIESDSVVSGGVPSGSLQRGQSDSAGADDLTSPLNDISHLDATEQSDTEPVETTVRRRVAAPAASDSASTTLESTTTTFERESSSTPAEDSTTSSIETTSAPTTDVDLTTTTEDESTTTSNPPGSGPPTTGQTTTTAERTTTTDDVTTTTKKRKRRRP